ncbi:hypothetical protein [Paenibacillus sp. PL91]|uniref:hypothetical protein n=1 Tax=Paenibacillus sp. PL91 TaxID=2729538 RepID=UPI00145DA6E1|nr:hypothetical protein [Paenibacillus sp. PL91]MBC9199764.1 hypothetical protein [Paenibacillus sp. PL91]
MNLYDKTNEIIKPITDHSGAYFSKHAWALHFKQITVREFIDAMLIADEVYSDGIAELRRIDFPEASQRAALAKFIESLRRFRQGIAAAIETAKSGEQRWEVTDKYFDNAYQASVDFWNSEGVAG